MSTTDAVNTGADKLFQYPLWTTRLSGDGEPPTTSGEASSALRAVSVTQSAGGQSLDNASLEWKVTASLVNRVQPANFSRMLDVLFPDSAKTRAHLGDYVSESEKVDKGETLTAQSQLRGYHFGDNHVGQWWWDSIAEAEEKTEFAPVFNPRVDGRILGNRSNKKHTTTSQDAYYFIHPEAVLTAEAQLEQSLTAQRWDLKEAVLAMCWECNSDETFIENPTRDDLSLLDNAPTLEDVKLESGKTLPVYLDRLLQPLGFNWHIKYDTGEGSNADGDFLGSYAGETEADAANPSPGADNTFFNTTTGTTWERNGSNTGWVDTGSTDSSMAFNKDKPQIVVFEKGVGPEKTLKFQAPGTTLDLNNSNVNNYSINRRIGDSVNRVVVVGDVERAEVTITLFKGWPESSDSLTATDLDKSATGNSYLANPTVWRLWVANESGDYTDTRTEIIEALNLNSVFSRWIPHRRQAMDPFTYQGGPGRKQRRQILVEYTTDGGSNWLPVPDEFGQPFILPDQIAVIFQGNTPPQDLIDAGANAGVRITCVIEGDARLTHTAERQAHAVNGRDVTLQLDVPQKFRKHWVQSSGSYASRFATETSGAEVADDTTEIQAYAEEIRDDNEVAELDAEIIIPGIHHSYEIGDLLTNIDGREVSLDQASNTAPTPRYPQIIKRQWRYSPFPSTVLTVDRGVRRRGGA